MDNGQEAEEKKKEEDREQELKDQITQHKKTIDEANLAIGQKEQFILDIKYFFSIEEMKMLVTQINKVLLIIQ